MKASFKNAYEKGCCTHYTETLIHATRSRRSGKYTQGRSTSFFQVLQRFTFLLSLMLYKKSSDEITSKNMSLPCVHIINTATMCHPPIYIFALSNVV